MVKSEMVLPLIWEFYVYILSVSIINIGNLHSWMDWSRWLALNIVDGKISEFHEHNLTTMSLDKLFPNLEHRYLEIICNPVT